MSEASPSATHRETPYEIDHMPPGIPYIVGNEAAERFSFYGMKAILTVFMVKYLLAVGGGGFDVMTDEQASTVTHLFVASAYFFPLFGAIVSDVFWGKYRTIMVLSVVYCLGHMALALDESRIGLFTGLFLIAIGSGGIKPCVSAHVGDQFGERNKHLLPKIFSWFYLAINLGAALSTLVTPILLDRYAKEYGASIAFGLPGLLMLIATIVFWIGRHSFVHVPPVGWQAFKEQITDPALNLKGIVLKLTGLYVFIMFFWSLFDQTASTWVLQAQRLDLQVTSGWSVLPSSMQLANPVFILMLVPVFTYGVYPLLGKVVEVTPLRKIGAGLFLAAAAFGISATIEANIQGGRVVSVQNASSPEPKTNAPASLIDPQFENGWVFKPNAVENGADAEPASIVLRLRDGKAWDVTEVAFTPNVGIPVPSKDGREPERKSVDAVTTVKVEASDSPSGPWTNVLISELGDEDETQSFELSEATAMEYVRLTFPKAEAGTVTGLGSVSLLTEDGTDVAAVTFKPWVVWQLLAYLVLTAAEVLVSVTALELSYTQAPLAVKSLVMSFYLLSVSAGNLFTAGVNFFIQNDNGTSKLDGASYYWFFTGCMVVAAIAFVIYSQFYQYQTFIQGEENLEDEAEATAEGTS